MEVIKRCFRFPQYKSAVPIMDALYNLGLEEMENAIEPDSTFRTGKEWAGVWTRDISYSIILSMATLQPKVAQYSSEKLKIIVSFRIQGQEVLGRSLLTG
ncbi:hypothetical protein CS542_01040 [Pedobacter sp. IW39]|nr:hypothetical protein CS542_01040 [Pedobacter sp. IW39]